MRKINMIISGEATIASVVAALSVAQLVGVGFEVDSGFDLGSGEEIIIVKGVLK